MEIRPIPSAEALAVRHPVLRAGLPESAARFANDDDPATVHLGAFDGARLVAVATFFPEAYGGRPGARAWRLRGMATLPPWRGRGMGAALVLEGERIARASGAAALWCNARLTARGFYEKLGFAIEGDPFELPQSGVHYAMVKDLTEPA